MQMLNFGEFKHVLTDECRCKLYLQNKLAPREPSDFKEALLLMKDVWKSATTMSGAQCVMICGELLMLKLLADS